MLVALKQFYSTFDKADLKRVTDVVGKTSWTRGFNIGWTVESEKVISELKWLQKASESDSMNRIHAKIMHLVANECVGRMDTVLKLVNEFRENKFKTAGEQMERCLVLKTECLTLSHTHSRIMTAFLAFNSMHSPITVIVASDATCATVSKALMSLSRYSGGLEMQESGIGLGTRLVPFEIQVIRGILSAIQEQQSLRRTAGTPIKMDSCIPS